ncbi:MULTISPECIES: RHS repeat-associated core domain-containing protein [Asticcacaulis]|uniref:RHS repeat-associated core domain-containing protein n=1 Tax=Asticcacaulis TaxID=76890 RepID=UPI001FD90307|nr:MULTISPECIES: RHS repeat-associated core domain-containing protein [Asticcacaulis]MBP2161257.1 RHS repeat-associated protein [Asticcacaulis solisilvae]MDR6802377.1 RHS repeat-associated protein [Asticcacaulis sp. BE141]
MPVAVIDKTSGTAVTYFIHTGHLNEPQMMTDTAKAKVWDAYVTPFGSAKVFTTAMANVDIRLPGQWFQAEAAGSGLNQNHHRDYDPSLGRYIQVDPIGLDGGQNPYAYVDGEPYNFVDPFGLTTVEMQVTTYRIQTGLGSVTVKGVTAEMTNTTPTTKTTVLTKGPKGISAQTIEGDAARDKFAQNKLEELTRSFAFKNGVMVKKDAWCDTQLLFTPPNKAKFGNRIDGGLFTVKGLLPGKGPGAGKPAWYDPVSKYWYQKSLDKVPHGGSFKLTNSKGERVATMNEDGVLLRY